MTFSSSDPHARLWGACMTRRVGIVLLCNERSMIVWETRNGLIFLASQSTRMLAITYHFRRLLTLFGWPTRCSSNNHSRSLNRRRCWLCMDIVHGPGVGTLPCWHRLRVPSWWPNITSSPPPRLERPNLCLHCLSRCQYSQSRPLVRPRCPAARYCLP